MQEAINTPARPNIGVNITPKTTIISACVIVCILVSLYSPAEITNIPCGVLIL